MRWISDDFLLVDGFGTVGMVYFDKVDWSGEYWDEQVEEWVKVARGETKEEAKAIVAAAVFREYIL